MLLSNCLNCLLNISFALSLSGATLIAFLKALALATSSSVEIVGTFNI